MLRLLSDYHVMFLRLVSGMLLVSMTYIAQADTIALLIGVQNYRLGKSDIPNFAQPPADLKGPRADVAAMSKVLRLWGVNDIRVLVDEQATQKGIVEAVAKLVPDSRPGDQVIVYFSGHGTSPFNRDAHQQAAFPLLPDQSGAWIPFGWALSIAAKKESKELERQRHQRNIDGLVVGRRDLRPIFEKLDRGGRKVFVISDSCFAGQLARSVDSANGTSANQGSKTYVMPTLDDMVGGDVARDAGETVNGSKQKQGWPYQNLVMLSASSEMEAAFEVDANDVEGGTFDGQAHGVMTDMLLQVLTGKMPVLAKGNSLSYTELRNTLESNKLRYPERKRSTISLLPGADEDAGKAVLQTVLNREAPIRLATSLVSPVVTVNVEGVDENLSKLITTIPGVQLGQLSATITVRKQDLQYQVFNGNGQILSVNPLSPSQVLQRIKAQVYLHRLMNEMPTGWAVMQTTILPAVSGGYLRRCQPFSLAAVVNRNAQLLLLTVDAEGQMALLYPAVNFNRAELSVKPANQKVIISPDVFVTPPFGTDQLLAIAIDPSVPGVEELSKKATSSTGVDGSLASSLEALVKAAKGKSSYQLLNLRTEDGPNHTCEK